MIKRKAGKLPLKIIAQQEGAINGFASHSVAGLFSVDR